MEMGQEKRAVNDNEFEIINAYRNGRVANRNGARKGIEIIEEGM